jgi:hypothetical protein
MARELPFVAATAFNLQSRGVRLHRSAQALHAGTGIEIDQSLIGVRTVAKRSNDQSGQRPNGTLRVRLFEVELTAGDAAIVETVRTVERMRRSAVEVTGPKRLTNGALPVNGHDAQSDERTLFDQPADIEVSAAEVGAAEVESSAAPADDYAGAEQPRRRRGDGDPKDHNAGIAPVGDINFFPTGKPSLKEFFDAKAPNSDMEQILVICHFLQHTAQLPKFGPGHVLSGLKHVGEPVPKSLKATIRNMKNKKAWLNFAPDIDNLRLTTVGENLVEHKLGKGKATE